MRDGHKISIVIPARDEALSIGPVLLGLPPWVDEVIVADNASSDDTGVIAQRLGARVVRETRLGYGAACLAGLAALEHCDIVVFMDADLSEDPACLPALLMPLLHDEADFSVGSRTLGNCDPGALSIQQRFGNALACFLISRIWKVSYTDLGPFRAIRHDVLARMKMRDTTWGWTVEMQIKAALLGIRTVEVPVNYRKRLGRSKISGTVSGVLRAGTKILYTIIHYAILSKRLGPGAGTKPKDP